MKSLSILNSSNKQTKLIVEPWAEEYLLDPKSTVEISSDQELSDSSIEIEYRRDCIIVFGWADNISVTSNGEKMVPFTVT